MNRLLCKIFGHPDRQHYHKYTDICWCNGGCERYERVYFVFNCPRCDVAGITLKEQEK